MTSYLIDGAVLLILLAVGLRVHMTARELRRLRDYHEHYQFMLDETATAVTAVDSSVREIQDHGAHILLALGQRIGEGYKVVGEIDRRMSAAVEQLDAEPVANSNVVHLAPAAPARREPSLEAASLPEPSRRARPAVAPIQARNPPRRIERPVQWPAAGERFSQLGHGEQPAPRAPLVLRSSG